MKTSQRVMGLTFKNPLLPASGPLVEGLENLISLEALGLGGMVTKTVSIEPALVNKPCIFANDHMVFNTELWSEYSVLEWVSILSQYKQASGVPLGISVGYTALDLEVVMPALDPFADFFEVSTHYNKAELLTMVSRVSQLTQKPVLIKMSPHITDDLQFVRDVLDHGASGIVAFNSFGPGMHIDLKTKSLSLGTEEGNCWVSGPAIKPFALRRIATLRKHFPDCIIIGCGGVATAEDLLEMILAGADLVQMLSSALINGRQVYKKILDDLPKAMDKYGIADIQTLRKQSLNIKALGPGDFPLIQETCTGCQRCVRVCPFQAYTQGHPPGFDHSKCMRCGLCESRCPAGAIKGVFTPCN